MEHIFLTALKIFLTLSKHQHLSKICLRTFLGSFKDLLGLLADYYPSIELEFQSSNKKVSPSVEAKNNKLLKTSSPFKEYLDFNGINRLNKNVIPRVHQEDEWHSYWDDQNDTSKDNDDKDDSFTSHLKVSEDKSLPKEDVQVSGDCPELNTPEKKLTTFAALKKAQNPDQEESLEDGKKSILDPVVNVYELNETNNSEETEETESKVESVNNSEPPETETKAKEAVNELKELVKQRYARRYRSKFPRRKSSNLIGEIIVEEDEDDLEAEKLELVSEEPTSPVKSILKRNSLLVESGEIDIPTASKDSPADDLEVKPEDTEDTMMMLKRQQKRKKGVTFSPISAPPMSPLAFDNVPETRSESSEDELNGYSKVVVSQNLAEEILDEIYGKLEAPKTPTANYENSVVTENGAIARPFHLHDPASPQPRSLADEILDELYGRKVASKSDSNDPDDNSYYEEISHLSNEMTSAAVKQDLTAAYNPAIAGKNDESLLLVSPTCTWWPI